MNEKQFGQLLAAINAQTLAINAQAAAIESLAQSNFELVAALAGGSDEEQPTDAVYLDGGRTT